MERLGSKHDVDVDDNFADRTNQYDLNANKVNDNNGLERYESDDKAECPVKSLGLNWNVEKD